MLRPIPSLLAAGALAGLAACTPPGADRVQGAFYSEAGALLDRGDFGNSTMNNHLSMTGRNQAYVLDLAERFAAEVPSTVTFAFNSARLEPEAMAILRQQADWIRQFPEVRFRVYGHTDLVGSTAYNHRLGLRRAQAVVGFFAQQGITRDRLEAVVSFGETQPVVPTPNRERLNRRTVTEVSGFYERHPDVLEGKYAEVVYREYVQSAQPVSQLSGVGNRGSQSEQ